MKSSEALTQADIDGRVVSYLFNDNGSAVEDEEEWIIDAYGYVLTDEEFDMIAEDVANISVDTAYEMAERYFSDEKHLTREEYTRMSDHYESMDDAEKERYDKAHPEFTEARAYVDDVSTLCGTLENMASDGKPPEEIGKYLAESGHRDEFAESLKTVTKRIDLMPDPYASYEKKESHGPGPAMRMLDSQVAHIDELEEQAQLEGTQIGT